MSFIRVRKAHKIENTEDALQNNIAVEEPADSRDGNTSKSESDGSLSSTKAVAEESRKTNVSHEAQKPALKEQKSPVFDENRIKKSVNNGEKLAQNTKNRTENNTGKPVKNDINTQGENNPSAIAKNEKQKSAIAQTDNSETAAVNKLQEDNALEKLEKEKNTDAALTDAKETEAKRWGISPRVAPVYYGSFSGSGIDPQFNDNAKEGDINMSYGVQISYAVNDRLKIRSGVNKVNLSYNTDNIGFSPALRNRSISSINYSKGANFIEVSDASTFSGIASLANAEIPNQAINGKLSQNLGYYEVPLEIEYALVDKKIALQVIGGLSTLFINDNEISIKDGGYSTPLGTSNSLNNVSFSTNVGLGIDYNLSEKLQFNLEPMFKYQLNSYKNTVSDFKPYYMGLYTGVSFKF